MDFYVKFTLRQWTGRVERAHINVSHDDWGIAGGQGIRHRGSCSPAGATHAEGLTVIPKVSSRIKGDGMW